LRGEIESIKADDTLISGREVDDASWTENEYGQVMTS